jgi:hypothetical protein
MSYFAFAMPCVSLFLTYRLYRAVQAAQMSEHRTLPISVADHRMIDADKKVRQVLMTGPQRPLPREI